MTTFQQAIDYVNSYMPVMFPGTGYRYTSSNLNSTDKLIMLGVQQLLSDGHTVDTIPPTGSEPDGIYAEAKRTIETLAASVSQTKQFPLGAFNSPVGRVYMAMLDNPPANAPKPGTPTPDLSSEIAEMEKAATSFAFYLDKLERNLEALKAKVVA